RAALATLDRRLAARHPGARLTAGRTALAQLRVRLDAAIARRRHDGAAQLGQLAGRLDALSPLRVLDRGYALVSRGDLIVRSSDDVAVGDRIAIRLAQGGVRATVDELGPGTPTPAPDAAPAPTRPRRPRAPKAER
ncbi:MAG: exodeoxyribonuclease VII large subunit, partial [Deltaproteobacteria bacterium]|nr:exodeoxyribonuclease VII large subunit [Deltaproteobacteria bacterium]